MNKKLSFLGDEYHHGFVYKVRDEFDQKKVIICLRCCNQYYFFYLDGFTFLDKSNHLPAVKKYEIIHKWPSIVSYFEDAINETHTLCPF